MIYTSSQYGAIWAIQAAGTSIIMPILSQVASSVAPKLLEWVALATLPSNISINRPSPSNKTPDSEVRLNAPYIVSASPIRLIAFAGVRISCRVTLMTLLYDTQKNYTLYTNYITFVNNSPLLPEYTLPINH